MVFSSVPFLFFFLPITLALYFLPWPWLGIGSKDKFFESNPWKNSVLLVSSLLFYTWGELQYVIVMLASAFIAWGAAIVISRTSLRKFWLTIGIVGDLSILGYFKYGQFIYENIFIYLPYLDKYLKPWLTKIHLPIGVSFFTFQAVSYIIDVYRKQVQPQRNFFSLLLYISFFPQLIAGPIVRYVDVAREIAFRRHSFEAINYGIQRFIVGLAQKVLIANQLGAVADSLYKIKPEKLDPTMCWIAALAYSFQIYYDFAGYSNMGIGLGRVFGLKFLENFNHPYSATSVTDFWRRWHISLSTWFRDYLYIPLGGNRRGKMRTSLNLGIVFLLCGLWHGASWHFVAWGAYHGLLLSAERLFVTSRPTAFGRKPAGRRMLSQLRTFILVVFGWVLFRVDTLPAAVKYWSVMLGFGSYNSTRIWQEVITAEVGVAFLSAVLFAFPIFPGTFSLAGTFSAGERIDTHPLPLREKPANSGVVFARLFLFLVTLSYLAAGTFNPFIYFRF